MRRVRFFLLFAALAGFGGCTLELEQQQSQVTPGEFHHRWAIDMAKVHSKVSGYAESPRFVASSVEQLLPTPAMQQQLGPGICEHEAVIGTDGQVEQGGCYAWALMQTRNYDHSRHVDDPANHPIVNIIDEQGNRLDPPGYLNIVALRRAERAQQAELRSTLRNGDLLVYFHPEDDDTTQYTIHHAAMYYDTGSGPLAISLGDTPFVHHVDNPTSYGPAFNAGASSTPFHVFRFSPNGAPNSARRDPQGRYQFACTDAIRDAAGPEECQNGAATFTITDEAAEQYAYVARNWALIDSDHVPFADFHTLNWHDAGQLARASRSLDQEIDRFATPILAGDESQTPAVYCAGLVFTNLTLGMNRPLSQRGLGPLYEAFAARTYGYDDGYMRYGEGQELPALRPEQLTDGMNLPRLGTYPVQPIMASDIIDSWLDGYYGGNAWRESGGTRGLPPQARAQVLAGAKQQLAGGFRSLRWDQAVKSGAVAQQNPVASEANVLLYADAYCGGCLNLPDAFFQQFSEQNRARVIEASRDLAKMKQLEADVVTNRYVPPPLYHVSAQREDSLLTYVATVIHEDLLQCIDPAGCGASGAGAATFMQGGPDSSLYPHYAVPNGGRHTQRLFAVDSGPQKVGYGSWVSTRISAADIRDVQVLLHPAGSFPAFGGADALYSCDRTPECLGGAPGIPLPISAALNGGQTAWTDKSVRFDLFRSVEQGGLGCVVEEDGRRTCPSSREGERIDVTSAYGQWTLTMIDLGAATDGVEVANCAECSTGGGHSNQWVLSIADGPAPSSGGGGGQTGGVCGEVVTVGGECTASVEHDATNVHTVEVPAGAPALRVTVTPAEEGADPDLTVTGPNDQSGSSANGAGEIDEVTITEEVEPGTWKIEVTGYSESAAGYTLSVHLDAEAAGQ